MVALGAAVLLQLLHAGEVGQEIANCSTHCGNISISYPFGIEPGCYHLGFNLSCDHSHNPPKLFLGDGTVEVLGSWDIHSQWRGAPQQQRHRAIVGS